MKKQKEDIEELAFMFKDMLGQAQTEENSPYIQDFESHFTPVDDFSASYSFMIDGIKDPLYVAVQPDRLTIHYGQENDVDVIAKMSNEVMRSILDGQMTFQRAFMTGEMTAKGNFKTLRMLDQVFGF